MRYIWPTIEIDENRIALLGEASVREIRCCPEMSRDTNGLPGIFELRGFLMQLGYPYAVQC